MIRGFLIGAAVALIGAGDVFGQLVFERTLAERKVDASEESFEMLFPFRHSSSEMVN